MNCFNVTTLTQGRNDVTCKNAYLGPHDPRFCYISFSEIGVFGVSDLALGLQSSWLSAAISSAFSNFAASINAASPPADRIITARNTKGRPLGERPAFLRSPPGCGVIEALGCVGRGFDERLGRPPAGYLDL